MKVQNTTKFIVNFSDSIGLNNYCGLQKLLTDSFIQIKSVKRVEIQFLEIKWIKFYLFKLAREIYYYYFAWGEENIVTDGLVYTIKNVKSVLSSVYEKVTY